MAAVNTVEFLRACTTNVRLDEGLHELEAVSYTPRAQGESNDAVLAALVELRRENVLCSLGANCALWVFGSAEGATSGRFESLEALGRLHRRIEGVLGSNTKNEESGSEALTARFLDAVEGSVTHLVSRNYGMLHVGPFSWVRLGSDGRVEEASQTSVAVKVHPMITPDGSLYISTTTEEVKLSSSQRKGRGSATDVILAPYGSRAKLIHNDIDSSPAADSELPPTAWKHRVSQTLLSECIELQSDEEWALVSITKYNGKRDLRFWWPARLCLARLSTTSASSMSKDNVGLAHWFNSPGDHGNGFQDPIAEAEALHKSVAELAMASNATLIADPLTSDTMAAASTVIAETPMATSPPFNQRLLDQQNAMAGIYPTPPDGFMPSQQHLNPTSDGLSAAMQIDSDNLNGEQEILNSDDHGMRGNSLDSARDGQPYEPHSDDLFGEMTEMDFGANEVGDADFDYFDDPNNDTKNRSTDEDLDMTDIFPVETTHSHASTNSDQNELDFDQGKEAMCPREDAPPSSQPPAAEATPSDVIETSAVTPRIITAEAAEVHVEAQQPASYEAEKPLTPFGIRDRLMPPPIPASVINRDASQTDAPRRSSKFDAVTFKDNINSIQTKLYPPIPSSARNVSSTSQPSISLPPKTKRNQVKLSSDPDSVHTDGDTSSDEDSYDSMTSFSDDEELPPKMPWETKKRKRSSNNEPLYSTDGQAMVDGDDIVSKDDTSEHDMQILLEVLTRTTQVEKSDMTSRVSEWQGFPNSADLMHATPLQDLFDLDDLQLVSVAQIVCEQAVTIPRTHHSEPTTEQRCHDGTIYGILSSVQTLVGDALAKVLPNLEDCTPTTLALIREPPPRPQQNPGKAPQAGQPRMPPQREGSVHLGPDYFGLFPPHVRVRRGVDAWDVLPPAINFWTALSLGPAGGTKDVTALFVTPANDDLLDLLQSFGQDLSDAYEGCKFGKFGKDASFHDKLELDIEEEDRFHYQNGVVSISKPETTDTFDGAMTSYSVACELLGAALGRSGLRNADNTIVVCLIDPFEDPVATKYLCACFWKLFSSCRESLPPQVDDQACSDLVLQIIPISLIASTEGMVVLDSGTFATLAMEIYNRCPPSTKSANTTDIGSALPILASPAVEIASTPPKRIVFSLTPDPPSDLVHEGSVLHLAYAISPDKQWMAVYWIDSTGRYQMSSTACMRGKSFREVAAEVWDRTLEILAARDVVWRLFIVCPRDIEPAIQRCWKQIAISKPRKQVLHVTLLSVEEDPPVHLYPSPPAPDPTATVSTANVGLQTGAGFLTPPVTTPSSSNAITVSPDATGTSLNGPSTPAANDSQPAGENDPDAYLVDTTDESWGMLLNHAFSSTSAQNPNTPDSPPSTLAKGLLLRRGPSTSPTPTPSHSTPTPPLQGLAVSLHWDIRIKGGVAEDPPVRQVEMTLREVLRMYRNLGVLARVTGLSGAGGSSKRAASGGNEEVLPLHILCVKRGAEAMVGYLS